MSKDGQGTKSRRNIAENLNRLSTAHERYRQTDRRQTDIQMTDKRQTTAGRAIAYSEREREFAKNHTPRLHEIFFVRVICGRGSALL